MTEEEKRYELLFECDFREGREDVENIRLVSRVIVFEDLATADKVAKAMVGEKISAHEFLGQLVDVKKTDKEPALGSWNEDSTWERVLSALRLTPDDIDFLVSEAGQKIGLKFKAP